MTLGFHGYPLDARTGMINTHVALSFSSWGALLEPIALPVHVLATLPDIRMGMVSMLTWFMFSLVVYAWFQSPSWCVRLKIWRYGIFYSLLYLIFALLIPLPNWALEKTNTHDIVADLHSHGLISHDGMISLQNNLKAHHRRGFDLVALTEHANLTQSVITYHPAHASTPEAIPGMEIPVYYGAHFYLSAVGFDATTPLPNGLAWYQGNKTPLPPKTLPSYIWPVSKLIQVIHQHGGAIAVVALNLDVKEVHELTQAGVDAFEIINFGHHPLPEDVRQAMLQAQKEHGVALIASNDWHGWTGVLNTWTLIHPDPALHNQPLKLQVIDALRHHGKNVVPLTAYPMHTMSNMEIIFAPFIAVYQYAKTISAPQLISLWAYFFLFLILSKYWRCQKISLAQATEHSLLVGMATAILWHSIALYHDWSLSLIHPPLAHQVSLYAMLLSTLVLMLEAYRIKRVMFK